MKKILFVSFLVLMFSTLGMSQEKPTYFANGEQCVEALRTGQYTVYVPGADNLFTKINPRTEMLTLLENDECDHMIVDRSKNMKDFYWVIQAKGTKMVKELRGLKLLRRYSCGNPINARMHVPIKAPDPTPTPATPTPSPTPIQNCIKVTDKHGNVVNVTLSLEQARSLGYTVDSDFQCYQPKPPPTPVPATPTPTPIPVDYCATVNGKPNDKRITVDEAIDAGYEVDDDNRCFVKDKGANAWGSALCGAGVGILLGRVKTGTWKGGAIGGAIGGVGGGVISQIPGSRTLYGCGAGAAALLLPKHKKARKVQVATPVGQGGLNGGGCIPGANNCPIITSVPTRPTASNPNPTGGTPVPTTTTGGLPPRRPFAEEQSGQQNRANDSGGRITNISQPAKTSCDADPTAICMNVLNKDGTTVRMRVN